MNIQEAIKALNDQSAFSKAAVTFKLLGAHELPIYRRVIESEEYPKVARGSSTIVDFVPLNTKYYPPEILLEVFADTLEVLLKVVAAEEQRFLGLCPKETLLYLSTRGWSVDAEGPKFRAWTAVSAIWM